MHDVAKTYFKESIAVRAQNAASPSCCHGDSPALAIGVFVFGIKFLQIGKMMSMPRTMPPTTVYERVGERGRLGSEADSGGIGSALSRAQLFPQSSPAL